MIIRIQIYFLTLHLTTIDRQTNAKHRFLQWYEYEYRSIGVKNHSYTLEYPMTVMYLGFQVCFEYHTYTHCISSCLCNVHRCLNGTTKLQFVGLDWDNLNKWHLSNQFLWLLNVKAVLRLIPSSSLNVKTLHISSLLKSLGDFRSVFALCDICKHR